MLMLPTTTEVSTIFFAVENQDKILVFSSIEHLFHIINLNENKKLEKYTFSKQWDLII